MSAQPVSTGRARSGPAAPRDDSRGRLLAAGIQCFATKGYDATTTRDIASAAEMSPAALYVHYSSKEQLLFEISRDGHQAVLEQMQAVATSTAGAAAQLRAVFRGFVAEQARDRLRARVVNFEFAALSAEHQDEIAQLRHVIARQLREIVEAGVAQGVFGTENVTLTSLALSSLGVDVPRWFRDDGEWTPDDVADHFSALALRMVGLCEE